MKVTSIDQIFNVNYGTNLELNNLEQTGGYIRFVSRTRKNNGLSAYVRKHRDVEPNPANTISVALGSSSVLFAFLQEEPYYSGRDIVYLEPLQEMTKNEMLFYCACIRANRYKYNFGRQANKTIATLKIPERFEVPEWVFRTDIHELTCLTEPLTNNKLELPMEYLTFDFLKVFEYAQEETHNEKKIVNLVSACTENNGIKNVVETDTYIDGNKITISSNGIYTGTAFYQKDPFVTQDSISVKLTDNFLNKYLAMYLVCVINNEKFRFNYGRKSGKSKLEQLKFRLPAKDNKPDWGYMEKYIKTLPYSKNI